MPTTKITSGSFSNIIGHRDLSELLTATQIARYVRNKASIKILLNEVEISGLESSFAAKRSNSCVSTVAEINILLGNGPKLAETRSVEFSYGKDISKCCALHSEACASATGDFRCIFSASSMYEVNLRSDRPATNFSA
jgi:hypothetical protein